ncbi:MAG: DnaB-like helicase C-terminal domain-containing protein [Myxococcaceae bacterium]|nr:DnaB-like helicase C-terminal domain-containing protein [Myxococcaceae bacterium]
MKDLFDVTIERRALGEMMVLSGLDATEAATLAERLRITEQLFTNDVHRLLWRLVEDELRAKRPATALDLTDAWRRAGRPANELMGVYAEGVGMGSTGIERAVEALVDFRSRRELVALATDLRQRAFDDTEDPESTQAFLARQLDMLARGNAPRARPLSEMMSRVAEQMARVGTEKSPVLKTGLSLWDLNIGGLHPTLTVIGGHASRGKSGLAGSIIFNLARAGHRPGLLTMEDPAESWLYRFIGALSRVPAFYMRSRALDAAQQEAVGAAWGSVEQIAENIIVDERKRLTPKEAVATARDMVLNHGCDSIWLDHAGELRYEQQRGGERFDLDVMEGIYDLRALAHTYNVPIVLLSHLTRGRKPPHSMEDFANAAAIERAARVAVIIWSNDATPLKPNVTVVKNTFGKRDFDMNFILDPESALVVEPETPKDEAPKGQEEMFS